VESRIEGDINLLGIFGMAKDVRNGYEGIRASFRSRATRRRRSSGSWSNRARARVDVLTNGVPVSMSVNAG
jgi:hypothetical protein